MKTLLSLLLLIPSLSWGELIDNRLSKDDDGISNLIFKNENLSIQYEGNWEIKDKNLSYCYNCVVKIIARNWYMDGFYEEIKHSENSVQAKGKFKEVFDYGGIREGNSPEYFEPPNIYPKNTTFIYKNFFFKSDDTLNNIDIITISQKLINQYNQNQKDKKNKEEEELIIANRKQTCNNYGFEFGTELFQNCILEILKTERELDLKEKELEIIKEKNNKSEISSSFNTTLINRQLNLQNTLTTFKLLNKLNTPKKIPQINCFNNFYGWSCM
ncbi:MAG: hypothetical protein O2784_06740 [Proteobacteria bacterium]|nr:hypothetical protein [Pseudomonadota bacterium]